MRKARERIVSEQIDFLRAETRDLNSRILETMRINQLELASLRASVSELAVGYRHMQIVLRAIILKEEGQQPCEETPDASTVRAEEDSTDPTDGHAADVPASQMRLDAYSTE